MKTYEYSYTDEQDQFLNEVASYMADLFLNLDKDAAPTAIMNALLGAIFETIAPEYRAQVYVKFVEMLQGLGVNVNNEMFIVEG